MVHLNTYLAVQYHATGIQQEQHTYSAVNALGSSTEIEADLELQKCSAYEIVNLSRQRVEMETNPAYGEVGQFHH